MSQYFKKIHKSAARNFVLTDQKRLDGSISEDLTHDLSLIAKMHGQFVFDPEAYDEVEKDFQEYIKPGQSMIEIW